MKTLTRLAICIAIMIQGHAYSQSGSMVEIRGGEFIPLYGTKTEVPVGDFLMDVYPVTNAEFLEFVEQNPRWRKSQVKQLFADENYLRSWKNDLAFGSEDLPNSPVTNVSWFAAKNYCECQGKRLPTVDEWEYVAMANETSPDARSEKSYNQYILSWYETPTTFKNTVGNTFKNYWGVYDLHGLVWEWTSDFNSVMIGGESRQDSTGDNNLFCGAAAVGATDLMNYAAFMRYAFRGSVKARYAVKNLGFRCVRDIEKTNL
ncbi:formylglycine-generating enzyme family protein [Salinimicrobium sp. MT39]|uniref:Formylglycine-generating enzyme family protein n=1 Tax=Salinimicrobium profundisediminis TaxID=2994553 RepID=A0A9X3I0B9_9FLAO|nr:formylglycine-generating enzyme family protein [Salinimicrobium profundisediminis]MCX2836767.1 formylglycine-generating enzyme family protein [Salinimicrobium profundisediminis]